MAPTENQNSTQGQQGERFSQQPPRQLIARRAFQLWQSHGCPAGTAEDDWLQAEEEMRRGGSSRSASTEHVWPAACDPLIDEASEESFPASDPPAWTHCRV